MTIDLGDYEVLLIRLALSQYMVVVGKLLAETSDQVESVNLSEDIVRIAKVRDRFSLKVQSVA